MSTNRTPGPWSLVTSRANDGPGSPPLNEIRGLGISIPAAPCPRKVSATQPPSS